jgi:hypothetical protein
VFIACHPERGRQPESRDPLPVLAGGDSQGVFTSVCIGRMPFNAYAPGSASGVLRLRACFASRSRHSAQDDRGGWPDHSGCTRGERAGRKHELYPCHPDRSAAKFSDLALSCLSSRPERSEVEGPCVFLPVVPTAAQAKLRDLVLRTLVKSAVLQRWRHLRPHSGVVR